MKNHENRPITMKNQPGTMKNHVKPTRNHENQPPLIQKRHVTDRGIQLTSFDPKTSRHRQGDPTDLL